MESSSPYFESIPIYNHSIFYAENKTLFWEKGAGKISMNGRIVFGKNSDFLELDNYDMICVIIENKKYEFFVKKVISNDLLILETHEWIDFDFEGEYIIGKEIIYEENKPAKTLENENSISISNLFNYFIFTIIIQKEHFINNTMLKHLGLKYFYNNKLIYLQDIPLSLYLAKPNFKNKLFCPKYFELAEVNKALLKFDLRKL